MQRLLVLAFLLSASVARADNSLLYAGAGISWDKLSDIVVNPGNPGTSFVDINHASWKAFAGFRPVRVLALEAAYIDLGTDERDVVLPGVGTCTIGHPNCALSTSHSDARAFAGYAVGFLPVPLPNLEVFGKAGLARWMLNASVTGLGEGVLSTNGTNFAWGVGTQVHVGNIGARLEYESFRIPSTNGAKIISLTVFLNLY